MAKQIVFGEQARQRIKVQEDGTVIPLDVKAGDTVPRGVGDLDHVLFTAVSISVDHAERPPEEDAVVLRGMRREDLKHVSEIQPRTARPHAARQVVIDRPLNVQLARV